MACTWHLAFEGVSETHLTISILELFTPDTGVDPTTVKVVRTLMKLSLFGSQLMTVCESVRSGQFYPHTWTS